MKTLYTYEDCIRYNYKTQLKKDSNKAGLILLLFFGVLTVLSVATMYLPLIIGLFNGADLTDASSMDYVSDSTFTFLMSGLVSLLTFFVVSLVYSLITKADLGKTYPVGKLGFKLTYHLCAVGFAICMIANYVSDILLSLFDMVGIKAITDTEYICENALDIALFYATVAVLPALIEEFAFRGVILNLLRKYSDGLAVLISGVTFGLMHGNFAQIPFALVVGLVLGYIMVKTNSLIPGIIIHFLNNALSVTFTLLSTNTDLTDNTINIIYAAVLIIISIAGITSLSTLINKHNGFFKLQGADDTIIFKDKVKTVCSSPTVISFAVISIFEALLMIVLAEVSI